MKSVDFYFDYLSPFAYLASLAAPDLCARLWGLDQLDYVELFLAGRDPLAGVDLAGLLPLGATALRPAPR